MSDTPLPPPPKLPSDGAPTLPPDAEDRISQSISQLHGKVDTLIHLVQSLANGELARNQKVDNLAKEVESHRKRLDFIGAPVPNGDNHPIDG